MHTRERGPRFITNGETMNLRLVIAGLLSVVLVGSLASASANAGQGDEDRPEVATGPGMGGTLAEVAAQKKESLRRLGPAIQARRDFLASQGSPEERSAKSGLASRINACQDKKTGALRISKVCSKNEKRLSWNAQGPAGPAGPSGPAGPAATALVYEDIFGPFTLESQFSSARVLTCTRGGTAINAGYAVDPDKFNFYVLGSWQSTTGQDSWYIRVENNNAYSAVEYVLTVYCLL
jgi:hypothetical protein